MCDLYAQRQFERDYVKAWHNHEKQSYGCSGWTALAILVGTVAVVALTVGALYLYAHR